MKTRSARVMVLAVTTLGKQCESVMCVKHVWPLGKVNDKLFN